MVVGDSTRGDGPAAAAGKRRQAREAAAAAATAEDVPKKEITKPRKRGGAKAKAKGRSKAAGAAAAAEGGEGVDKEEEEVSLPQLECSICLEDIYRETNQYTVGGEKGTAARLLVTHTSAERHCHTPDRDREGWWTHHTQAV